MKPRHRRHRTFSLRTLLAISAAIAIILSVIIWRAESRRKVFDGLHDDGAIIRYTTSRWGKLFTKPSVAEFYVNVEGERLRIGDTLYSVDEAEKFFLAQKNIANQNGLNSFRFYTMENADSQPSKQIHNRIFNFGVSTFGMGGGFDRVMYEAEWKPDRKPSR